MACKLCTSENLQDFAGELSAVFPDINRSNLSPVYICQHILVCLDCGFAELVVPAPELERLKKGMAGSRSAGAK